MAGTLSHNLQTLRFLKKNFSFRKAEAIHNESLPFLKPLHFGKKK